MGLFSVQHDTARPPAEAWARVTDWPRHAQYVPFTRIRVTTAPPTGVGTTFVARSALGRVGFDDPMTVVSWQPPGADGVGRCRLEKSGRVMLGWAELSVEPHGSGARVTWTEDVTVARLPRFADRATALSARLMFARVLRRLVDD